MTVLLESLRVNLVDHQWLCDLVLSFNLIVVLTLPSILFLATATIDIVHDGVNSDDIILPSHDHTSLPAALPTTRSHMGNLLDQLDTSIQLRRIAMEAEQVSTQSYSHVTL